jgi:hypothetical protein
VDSGDALRTKTLINLHQVFIIVIEQRSRSQRNFPNLITFNDARPIHKITLSAESFGNSSHSCHSFGRGLRTSEVA